MVPALLSENFCFATSTKTSSDLPFNPSTTIKYSIPIDSRYEYQDVRLVIYDILGRKAATLANEKQKPGEYEVIWDASQYPSGVYFYKLSVDDYSITKKLVLLK